MPKSSRTATMSDYDAMVFSERDELIAAQVDDLRERVRLEQQAAKVDARYQDLLFNPTRDIINACDRLLYKANKPVRRIPAAKPAFKPAYKRYGPRKRNAQVHEITPADAPTIERLALLINGAPEQSERTVCNTLNTHFRAEGAPATMYIEMPALIANPARPRGVTLALAYCALCTLYRTVPSIHTIADPDSLFYLVEPYLPEIVDVRVLCDAISVRACRCRNKPNQSRLYAWWKEF